MSALVFRRFAQIGLAFVAWVLESKLINLYFEYIGYFRTDGGISESKYEAKSFSLYPELDHPSCHIRA